MAAIFKMAAIDKNTRVSDLRDGRMDLNENWYIDRMEYPEYFDKKNFKMSAIFKMAAIKKNTRVSELRDGWMDLNENW